MNKDCYLKSSLKSTLVPPLSGRQIPPLIARTKPLAVLPSPPSARSSPPMVLFLYSPIVKPSPVSPVPVDSVTPREMLATSAVQSVQAALNDLESRYQVSSN